MGYGMRKGRGFAYNGAYVPANGQRDYVHNYFPPEEHHSGLDEGYYYDWCEECQDRTEFDDGVCCVCNMCKEG